MSPFASPHFRPEDYAMSNKKIKVANPIGSSGIMSTERKKKLRSVSMVKGSGTNTIHTR